MDDEGSFAAGRQALLDALQSLEQRAHERAERMVRDAERTARQLSLDSEQRAFQLTQDAEERARQMLAEAEQRSKQVSLETATRLAELEQQLSEVRDQLEASRAQIEEQVVSVRGQVEMARTALNTVRQQLTSSTARRANEQPAPRINPVPRASVPRLSNTESPAAQQRRLEDDVAPALNDLRAAVDALKRPRRAEPAPEPLPEPSNNATEADEAEPSDASRRL
jgi:chromosome segregation ATPase